YLKHDIGPKLWKLLSQVLEEKVSKTNFRMAIERQFHLKNVIPQFNQVQDIAAEKTPLNIPSDPVIEEVTTLHQDWGDVI
ncbi:MAG: hypothetical protein ACYTXP_41080, partial [Nostoc sp.]